MKYIFALLLLSNLLPQLTFAQEHQHNHEHDNIIVKGTEYDKDLLPASFHKERREALRSLMPDSSVAVFFSNPIHNYSNDVDFEFHQDPNFYYLTGLRESNAILFIFKEMNAFGEMITNELIFVEPRNEANEVWTGKVLGVDGVKSNLGFEYAISNKDFGQFKIDYQKYSKVLGSSIPEDVKDNKFDKGDLYSMLKVFKQDTDTLDKKYNKIKLIQYMAQLRQIKTPEEILLMRKAIEITCSAQTELMKSLKPDMTEYQSEAIVEFTFKVNGAESVGFPSILGGGENSCILHYSTNRKELKSKDLLVCDIGAEYHGYTADVTRTIPVDGKYSTEEKTIYDLVLKAQNNAMEACKPGNKFFDPHEQAVKTIAKGLMDLKIIEKYDDVYKYFIHGTSHYLGLDVHDVGLNGALQEGNVITVEPGIYIPEGSPCDPKWWNIGVRIEDDILITKTGYENLSDCVPRETSEIERIMASSGTLDKAIPEKK